MSQETSSTWVGEGGKQKKKIQERREEKGQDPGRKWAGLRTHVVHGLIGFPVSTPSFQGGRQGHRDLAIICRRQFSDAISLDNAPCPLVAGLDHWRGPRGIDASQMILLHSICSNTELAGNDGLPKHFDGWKCPVHNVDLTLRT